MIRLNLYITRSLLSVIRFSIKFKNRMWQISKPPRVTNLNEPPVCQSFFIYKRCSKFSQRSSYFGLRVAILSWSLVVCGMLCRTFHVPLALVADCGWVTEFWKLDACARQGRRVSVRTLDVCALRLYIEKYTCIFKKNDNMWHFNYSWGLYPIKFQMANA